ncbi:MAG: nucleotidyltransferase family protein [Opitutaceae bacterium]
MTSDCGAAAAIVLAAGLSRRAAPENKLLFPFAGSTIIRKTTEAVCGAGFGEVLVVVGHERERVKHELRDLPVRFVFARQFALGMGHSLAAGVREAAFDTKAFAIFPGDLPLLTPAVIRRICEEFTDQKNTRHVIPVCRGTRGHPVILGAWLRPGLENLTGDTGAKGLLEAENKRGKVCFLDVEDESVMRDFDRPQATDSSAT